MLQVQHICKEYRTGSLVQKALDDVSLNLRDNEFVAILGPSGSGKTTLLNIIGGLDQYDSGDLIINGISTKKYKDRDWDSYRNHTIGFVFQSYNLIPHQTLLSNVELALTISGIGKSERRKRAKKALDQVGLLDQAGKKPNQLSGGQMQRVAIARALVNNPDILLADEPTGALDTDTSVQVMDLLKEVARDRLVVMVTHNPELAEQYATRIVNLRDGKIRSDTDPFVVDETLAAPPVHKNMGKSSMSLGMSVALSFNNLRTKKARTILTSFAGSIGIIGIALILSLSTGVNEYIASVEEETLSGYPLEITSTGFDISSLLTGTLSSGSSLEAKLEDSDAENLLMADAGSGDAEGTQAGTDPDDSEPAQAGADSDGVPGVLVARAASEDTEEETTAAADEAEAADADTEGEEAAAATDTEGEETTAVADTEGEEASATADTEEKESANNESEETITDDEEKAAAADDTESETDTDDSSRRINVIQMISAMFSTTDANDLASLKTWLDSGESGMEEYVNAIEYSYDIVPQIYRIGGDTVRQVHPDSSFSSMGFGSSASSSSLLSSMMSTDVFYQLPQTEKLYKESYEVKAGRWPENEDELVLVLNSDGSISDFLLYTLGLRDAAELDEMVQQFVDGGSVETPDNIGSYYYDDVLGTTFRLVSSTDYYEYDEEYGLWTDKSGNEEYMKELVENGEELTIVGIIQAADGSDSSILSSGIYYTSDLITHVAEVAAKSDIVQSQLADPDTNVFTGEPFETEEEEEGFDLASLVQIDEDALSDAFDIDTSALSSAFSGAFDVSSFDVDLGSMNLSDLVDLSDLSITLPDMPDMSMSDLMGSITIDASAVDLTALSTSLLTGFETYAQESTGMDYSKLTDYFMEYLFTDGAQTIFREAVVEMMGSGADVTVNTDQISSLATDLMNGYLSYALANGGIFSGSTSTDSSDSAGSLSDAADALSDAADSAQDTANSLMNSVTAYLYTEEAQTLMQNWLTENIQVNNQTNVTSEQIQTLVTNLIAGYDAYAAEKGYPEMNSMGALFMEYLGTDSATAMLTEAAMQMVDMDALEEQIASSIETYMSEAMASYGETLAASLEEQISAAMTDVMSQVTDQITAQMQSAMAGMSAQIGSSLTSAFGIDGEAFMEAFSFDMDSDDLTEMLVSLSSMSSADYESNLETLGYVDFDSPSEIAIYPIDFESKESVVEILDYYNEWKQAEGNEEQVITYTDTVGTLMSSVTDIINIISYVLIAFVAISLVVSSIMIGVITYISVLERKKEIGILRAIGASKRNISEVFNAETGIIGLCAGLLGIGLALLLTIPGNALIHHFAGSEDVNMVLMPQYAILLILLSMCLTLIGGLIPSGKASRSDPVTALRTE
ncbi:MAG: ATP-binding cassette domain-containing protein [Lachnospiraceae bacterium]|nr:ATP-binding cassette domain-containing protein [Lachnospiraceae bacterium]